MDFISDYVRHNWPHLPGGVYTLSIMAVVLVGLLMLYKHTGWGGWAAWFLAVGLYCVPVLIEFHR